MEVEAKQVKVHLKIEPSVYEALQLLAREGDRTVAAEMRRALRAHVEAAQEEIAA